MEVCFKCKKPAIYICPDCSTKACRDHLEKRYVGMDRGLRSRYMCPKCWKIKHKVLNENMVNARTYKPKKFHFMK